jgi:hypothetical protein
MCHQAPDHEIAQGVGHCASSSSGVSPPKCNAESLTVPGHSLYWKFVELYRSLSSNLQLKVPRDCGLPPAVRKAYAFPANTD